MFHQIGWTEAEKHGHLDRIHPTINLKPEQLKWFKI